MRRHLGLVFAPAVALGADALARSAATAMRPTSATPRRRRLKRTSRRIAIPFSPSIGRTRSGRGAVPKTFSAGVSPPGGAKTKKKKKTFRVGVSEKSRKWFQFPYDGGVPG